jgi:uncharacterized lipoprotein YddW (UPF0748 family)
MVGRLTTSAEYAILSAPCQSAQKIHTEKPTTRRRLVIFDRRFRVASTARRARLRRVWSGLFALPACLATAIATQPTAKAQSQPVPAQGSSSTSASHLEDSADPVRSLANSPDAPGEMRGMWVICYSLQSPASVHQVVLTAQKYHLNAIFVQVRSRADAWYNSPYEPRAEGLADQPRSFDPLAQIVAEGHAAGLQVHAWLNTYLTWSHPQRPRSPQHVWNAHPDWFAHDIHGRLSTATTENCEGVFLQASNPAVQQHLFDVFTDVAHRYDVDGIHFDFVRYPNRDYDFSPATLARFRASLLPELLPIQVKRLDSRLRSDPKIYVHAFGKEWQTWRRAQITALVTRVSTAAKADKPWMQVSAAVFANADDAYNEKAQDWMTWIRTGALDSISLMAYASDTQRILAQTRYAVSIAGERHVYTGIGAWRLSAHDVAHKIAALRKAGAAGINLFSYDDVHDRKHYLDTLARGVFASRSAPPRMRWLPGRSAPFDRSAMPAPDKQTAQPSTDKR